MSSSGDFGGYRADAALESRDGIQAYRAVDQRNGSWATLLVYRDAESSEPRLDVFERDSEIRNQLKGLAGAEQTLFGGRTGRGVPYLVLPGRTPGNLASLVGTRRLSIGEAVELTISVGTTLSAMNGRGIVISTIDRASVSLDSPPMFRDLSNARIVGREGETPPRSDAPEIARGEAPTALTDVWAMAQFLQELLAGDSGANTGWSPLGDAQLPEKLADVITRALSLEPIDRQPSIASFLDAVSEAVADAEVDPNAMMGASAPPDTDDDPTVQADEDLIRQIREASTRPVGDDSTPEDDPTVVADEDLIRQIRVASSIPETPTMAEPDNDPTSIADDDLIRQIRTAASTTPPPVVVEDDDDTVNADEDLIREIRASSASVDLDDAEDDATIVAGEDLVRQLRVAGTTPARPKLDEPPDLVPISVSRGNGIEEPPELPEIEPPPVAAPEAPAPSVEDLRRRFSPHVQQKKSGLVPTWILIVGAGAIGLLLVAILAVVIVG